MLQYKFMTHNYATFYIVRHGQTDWNVQKLIQGQTDVPLNTFGEEQAKNLGKELQEVRFDAVFSSDLLRAKRTAELILLNRKIAIKTTQALREQVYGRFEGKPSSYLFEELKDLFKDFEKLSVSELMKRREDPTMETHEEVVSRFIIFLREVAVAYQGKAVLIATHGGVMRYFLIHLGYGTYNSLPSSSIKNTAYLKIDCDGVDFFIRATKGIEKVINE